MAVLKRDAVAITTSTERNPRRPPIERSKRVAACQALHEHKLDLIPDSNCGYLWPVAHDSAACHAMQSPVVAGDMHCGNVNAAHSCITRKISCTSFGSVVLVAGDAYPRRSNQQQHTCPQSQAACTWPRHTKERCGSLCCCWPQKAASVNGYAPFLLHCGVMHMQCKS